MGLIRDLISNVANTKIEEQRQRAQQQVQMGELMKYIWSRDNVKPDVKAAAQSFYLDLLGKHGGKKGREMLPQIASTMSAMSAMQTMSGLQKKLDEQGMRGYTLPDDQAEAARSLPLSTGGGAGAMRTTGLPAAARTDGAGGGGFRPVLSALAGVGRGMLGVPRDQPSIESQLPAVLRGPWEMTPEEQLERERTRIKDAVARGDITEEEGKDAIARAITGAPTTTGTEQARYFQFPATTPGGEAHTETFHVSSKTGEFFDQYGRKVSGKDIEARGGKEVTKPGQPRFKTRVVSGQDPVLRDWVANNPEAGITIDPNDPTQRYTYEYLWDPETKSMEIVGTPGIGAQTASSGRNILSQFQESAKYLYKQANGQPITADQAKQIGALEYQVYRGTQTAGAQQRMEIQEFLTGFGPGMGLMLPQASLPAGIVPINPSGLPPGVQPLPPEMGGSGDLNLAQPSAAAAPGGAPAPAPAPGGAPGAPAAPPAAKPAAPPGGAASGQPPVATITPPQLPAGGAAAGRGTLPNGTAVTPQQQNFVTQYVNSITKDGPVNAAGALQGQQFLQRNGVDAARAADEYIANRKAIQTGVETRGAYDRFVRQIDIFGGQFLDAASKIGDAGSEILNTPLRELGPKLQSSPKMRKYFLSLQPLQRAYAAISSNAAMSRAQLPVGTQNVVDKLLDKNVSLKEARAYVEQLKTEGRGEMYSFDQQLNDLQTRQAANPIARALGYTAPPPLAPLQGGEPAAGDTIRFSYGGKNYTYVYDEKKGTYVQKESK